MSPKFFKNYILIIKIKNYNKVLKKIFYTSNLINK